MALGASVRVGGGTVAAPRREYNPPGGPPPSPSLDRGKYPAPAPGSGGNVPQPGTRPADTYRPPPAAPAPRRPAPYPDWARQNSLGRQIAYGQYGSAMAGADADNASAFTDYMYNNAMYGQNGWQRQDLANTNAYNEGMYGVNRGENDVRLGAINRQPGYLGDMRNIDAWRTIGDVRTIDIENAANERQFGLINAARGDVGANRDRELARLTDVQAGIGDQEAAAKRQEKQAQLKAFSDAAASGNVSVIAQMNSGELRSSLKDNLAEFQRQRAQAKRDTDQANQDYATKMRELQEQEATATDARELGKIRREMRMLDEQASKRKYQEDLAQVEDERKLNFLNLMGLEYARKRDQEGYRIGLGGLDARSQYGLGQFTSALGKGNAAKLAAESDWQTSKAMYPLPKRNFLGIPVDDYGFFR